VIESFTARGALDEPGEVRGHEAAQPRAGGL
jgi:hypothetical protein